MNRGLFVLFLVVFVLLLASTGAVAQSLDPAAPQAPLGTGFTYQGQLKTASGPVNGTCDLQFSLWDAAGSGSPPTGGTQIGGTQSLVATATNGLFTVVLNAGSEFGGAAFTGEARWLQIAARCPAGSGSYATLSPRQALTAAPYALSLKPDARINGLVNTGNLSFGNATRQMLNLWGTEYGIGVQSYDIYFRTDSGAGFAWFSGGEHSNLHYNPGLFGTTLMTLDAGSGLTVAGKVSASANSAAPGSAVFGTNTGAGYGLYGTSNGGSGVIGEGGTSGVSGIANSTTSIGVHGLNTSVGGDGVRGESRGCSFPENCWAGAGVHGVNTTGAGVLGEGGTGVLGYSEEGSGVEGQSSRGAGVRGHSGRGVGVSGSCSDSYGVDGWSLSGQGVHGSSLSGNGVQGNSSSSAASGVYGENFAGGYGVAGRANGAGTAVLGDNPSAGGYAGLFHGRVRVEGNLEFTGNLVGGNKSGYVSDFALNDGQEALSSGDVIVVVGYTTPMVGTIPVARVIKASSPYQTGVVGVVDQHVLAGNGGNGLQFADEPAAPGEHVNIVTLGMYRSIKVDADFAAIHPGDLLVASPHAGYAMKATDRTQAIGAIVGKALGDLATGEGALPVIVTLQ